MTYIYTLSDGWFYLSSILDLHPRKIIAWRLFRQMATRLVIETLQDALSIRTAADGLSFTQIEGVNIQVRNTTIILNTTVFDIPIVLRDAHTTIAV